MRISINLAQPFQEISDWLVDPRDSEWPDPYRNKGCSHVTAEAVHRLIFENTRELYSLLVAQSAELDGDFPWFHCEVE